MEIVNLKGGYEISITVRISQFGVDVEIMPQRHSALSSYRARCCQYAIRARRRSPLCSRGFRIFAEYSATRLSIPTIVGIGAGPGTSRRPVLIWDNMIRRKAKFMRRFPSRSRGWETITNKTHPRPGRYRHQVREYSKNNKQYRLGKCHRLEGCCSRVVGHVGLGGPEYANNQYRNIANFSVIDCLSCCVVHGIASD